MCYVKKWQGRDKQVVVGLSTWHVSEGNVKLASRNSVEERTVGNYNSAENDK